MALHVNGIKREMTTEYQIEIASVCTMSRSWGKVHMVDTRII